jgi:nucleoside-diphosphate-sugar epimerase
MWRALEAAHRSGEVQVVAARSSDFFGPGVKNSAVGERFFGPLGAGKPVQVVGDPERLHTYTYVPDFGEAMVRLSETPDAWGKAWHVPNAPTTSTREFAERAANIASTKARLRRVNRWQLRLVGVVVPAVREIVELLYEFEDDWVVDHARYAALVGDHATSRDEALRTTIESHHAPQPTKAVRQ